MCVLLYLLHLLYFISCLDCNLSAALLQPQKQTLLDPVVWWAGVHPAGKSPCMPEGEGWPQGSHGSWHVAAMGESQRCSVDGDRGLNTVSGTFPDWMALGESLVSTQHGRAACGRLGSDSET